MAHAISFPADAASDPDPLLVYDPHCDRPTATVEIVIPVYNEEAGLEDSVRALQAYLTERFPLSWTITIADNASIDRTWPIACRLALILEGVRAVHLAEKGRGRALRAVWSASQSPVVAYMDVDLSTDLAALLPLVAPLVSGHSDVAIGTRLAPTARVARGAKREAISRTYNLLLRAALRAGFSDAQCGFKALRTEAVHQLLPLVVDQGWFFDTELLVLAEHNGLRIHEVPVDWIDDPDSRVNVVSTARGDLAGMWRMMRRFARNDAALPANAADRAFPGRPFPARPFTEQLVRFGSIGIVSSAVFALGFVLLAGPLGHMAAAVVALAVCSVANHAANRRLTFALTGPAGRLRHFARALAVAVIPFAATIATLLVLAAAGSTRTLTALMALTIVNVVVGLVRFGLLQRWVFGRQPGLAKLLRYAAVSGVSTATSQIVLATLVATRASSPVAANVIATMVGTLPSFELNRRWVWGKQGRRSLAGEIVPFAALAAAGLGLSTVAVAIMSRWAEHFSTATRTLSIEAASLAAFGAVWLVQFVVLDRVLFKHRVPAPLAAAASATSG